MDAQPAIAQQLSHAAATGDSRGLRAALKAGADANHADDAGQRPLHLVAQEGHAKLVKVLLDAGAELDPPDEHGWTPLTHAVWMMGQPQVTAWEMPGTKNDRPVTFRIRHGLFVCVEDGLELPMPIAAVRRLCAEHMPEHLRYLGRRDTAIKLLRLGADPNRAVDDGRTLLHLAAGLGEKTLFDALAKAIRERHDDGKTALQAAMARRDDLGRTVAHLAAGSRRPELVRRQKALAKADFEATDAKHWRPLHHAARAGDLEMVKVLCGRRPPVSLAVEPRASDTAGAHGHVEVAAWLRENEDRLYPEAGMEAPAWMLDNALKLRTATHDVEAVIAGLAAGDHVLADLPRVSSSRDGAIRVHAWIDERWIEAWISDDGGVLDDIDVHAADELVRLLRDAAEGGRVQVRYASWRAYPDGAREALHALVRRAGETAAELDGAHWLRVGTSGFALMQHAELGALSVIYATDDQGRVTVTSAEPSTPKRISEEAGRDDAGIEPLPEGAAERIAAIGQRASELAERVDSGKWGVLMGMPINDDLRVWARIDGTAVLLHFVAGGLREARFHRAAERLTDAIWQTASTAGELAPLPSLSDPRAGLLLAALRGDAAPLADAAAAGWLVARGDAGDQGFKLTGGYGKAKLADAEVSRDQVLKTLQDASYSMLSISDPPADATPTDDADGAAMPSDEALAARAESTSPADLVDAVRRSGIKALWRAPGPLEVSIWGYSVLFFDGSDQPQSFPSFLRDGPIKPLPDDVEREVRDAVRSAILALD